MTAARTWPAILVAIALTLTACSTPSATPATSATVIHAQLSGSARTLAPGYLGESLSVAVAKIDWSASGPARALASLHPGTLRYPGGTLSNFWDWHTGWYVAGSPLGAGKRPPGGFSLATLTQMVHATGAVPIFDLNMVTDSLPDQLAMLRAAAAAGLSVRNVELGNELYLSKYPQVIQAFPTGASYGTVASQWIATLAQAFPNARFAVSLAPATTGPARERGWNAGVLSTLHGAQAGIVHVYGRPNKALHLGAAPATMAQVPAILALPFAQWASVQRVALDPLPPAMSTWVTEFNMGNDVPGGGRHVFVAPQASWINGLFAATMGLVFLDNPRVQLADLYGVGQGGAYATFASVNQATLTPTGTAAQLLAEAANVATSAQPLSFAGSPSLPGGAPGVIGWRFQAGAAPHALVLNLSAVPLRLLALPGFSGTASVTTVWSTQPLAASAAGLHRDTSTLQSDTTLPAYGAMLVTSSA